MTRSQKQYGDSFVYEAFMTRAYRAGRDFKKGTDNGEFRLLEHIENGHYGKQTDFSKQVAKLKKLLATAIDKVLKWKLTMSERADVLRYARLVEEAHGADDLAVALNGLLDATHRLKEG
jgi:hypothetical protein